MACMGFTGLYLAVGPDLPAVDSIRQIRLQTPMSVYAKDGQLINEFGAIRRIPITLDDVPQDFVNALLATEDVRFFEHSGVDLKGVLRAVFKLAMTGTKSQGASTITMLVARNYYLSREKRFSRKFTEMFVAWKLESALTKKQILELFLNKIPFGHRAAGLGAAAQVYYGKKLHQLNLSQLAILAGIPNGPSIFNPISHPDNAKNRRNHVLGRMLSEKYITQQQYQETIIQPTKTSRHGAKITVKAPYLAEMVHTDIIKKFGREAAHSDGLKIFTSLNSTLQRYAKEALISSLLEYDQRHGYRGVEAHYSDNLADEEIDQQEWLSDFSKVEELTPALVLKTEKTSAEILLANGSHGKIRLEDSLWARKYIDENHRDFTKLKNIQQIVTVGDVIRVLPTEQEDPEIKPTEQKINTTPSGENTSNASTVLLENTEPRIYLLSQIPDANSGFVVLNPNNGGIEALVGGFNFRKNQFNMVSQARRQIGSNIKPFIYSSALNKNFTAASLINDSPIIDWDSSADVFWRPENDSENYHGPMRLRHALRWSVNTVSVRLIQKIGAAYAKKYLTKIGFPAKHMQPYKSLALGSASFTPLEVATSYAVLANGGYKIIPWYIERIEDSNGQVLFEQQPVEVCESCIEQLKEEQLMTSKNKAPAIISKNSDSDKKTDLVEKIIQQPPLQPNQEKPLHNLPRLQVAKEKIATRVIDSRNRYIIDSILKDVIHRGTAWRTLYNSKSPLLKRNDLAGKTGTTNEYKDAWFSGYNSQFVASAWVGFVDHSKKLGKKEFGAKAALPIWQKFMEKALKGRQQFNLPRPNGIVDVKIDLENGLLASADTKTSDFELFRVELVPTEYSEKMDDEIPYDQFDENTQEKASDEIEF